jgi:hypothetical protein
MGKSAERNVTPNMAVPPISDDRRVQLRQVPWSAALKTAAKAAKYAGN